jgi:hypothetical protein
VDGHRADRAGHGGREQREADDREPVATHHDALLVLLAELDAVMPGGRDQARGGCCGAQQGHKVDRLLKKLVMSAKRWLNGTTSRNANST